MEKEIDISIVTYNSINWLDGFIDSLLKQAYPCKCLNIYVTDNSSQDGTFEKLLAIKSSLENLFNKFVVMQEKNKGFGNGHNNNINNSTAEYILVTNIDLLFEDEAIVNVVTAASCDPISVASWELRQKPFEHPKNYNPLTMETSWSSSACVLFRRSALNQVGGYEQRIFMYEEDVELSFRLRDYGFTLKYCPKAVCWHYSYEYENQIKPLQFLGSALGNIYVRLRYGSVIEIIKGFIFYFVFLLTPEKFNGQRKGLLRNLVHLIYNAPYFLLTRKKSKQKFSFIGRKYEIERDGAFYIYKRPDRGYKRLISVIIRTYGDRQDYLKQALASVYNQTYTNIEIVIIEDGTNKVKDYVELNTTNNIRNIIYKAVPKEGRCKAGNAGLAAANGDYLIFLDDDDLFYPEHLEVLAAELGNDSGVSAVYSSAFEVPTKITAHDPFTYVEKEPQIIYKQSFSRPLLWYQNFITIQSVLFKRELYEQYGGFDEELENFEDWNLWTRYSLKHDFKFISKTTSMYRVPAEKKQITARQQSLDFFYNKALEKQKELQFVTTPAEVNAFFAEINDNLYIMHVSVKDVKQILKRHAFLNKFYFCVRKLHYKFKK